MSNQPEITLKQIKARASSQSFSRGENYYHQGAVSNTVRRDNKIEALCQGSYPQPYRTWALFDGSAITATGCNCQYDWGGDCKHIIALLLTYLHHPEDFDDRPTMDNALMSRSKEDLIYIIEQMITRYPDLQSIVDRPTPNEVVEGTVTLDTLTIRQELREAFNGHYDDYDYTYGDYPGYGYAPERKVHEIIDIAQRFAGRDDWFSASNIYRAILEEFADADTDYYYDEDGSLADAINVTISNLRECLDQQSIIEDNRERQANLNALLGIYIWDVDFGGIDMGYEAPEIILHYVRREDIPEIRQVIETARDRKGKSSYGKWGVERYNSFLMELDTLDETDPEVTLKRLREQGMDHLLIDKLLELGRVDEAQDVIKSDITGPYEMLKALNLFVSHRHTERAIALAEKEAGTGFEERIVSWLIEKYQIRDNQEKELHWQRIMMRNKPGIYCYTRLKQVAQALNQWDTIYPEIIDNLQNQERFDTLTHIYLNDEEWELAWKTFPRAKRQHNWLYGNSLELEVAQRSHHAMPELAIPVYIKYARRRIEARGRDNYQEAAGLLVTVQHMYDQLDEYETWETLIADLRQEFKRLPALQDELNKAGL